MKFVYALTAVLFAANAWAMSLDAAKDSGAVGETGSGYLAAVAASPSAEVRTLVSDINAKRKAEYVRISKANGQPLAVIEQLAGKKTRESAPAGQYIQDDSGRWVRK